MSTPTLSTHLLNPTSEVLAVTFHENPIRTSMPTLVSWSQFQKPIENEFLWLLANEEVIVKEPGLTDHLKKIFFRVLGLDTA